MIRNYIKSGLRAIFREKKTTIVNLVSLSVSLMASILISLWISDELTFNRIFSKADNIYQLSAKFDDQNDKFIYTSPPAISTFAAAGIPAIDQGCKVLKSMRISFRNEQVAYDENGLYADPSFFNIFDLPAKFIHENQPFSTPRSIVISKRLAQKYFGSQNPLGQTIELELDWIIKTKKEPFVVSGIIENFPENSSLKGDFILPMELLKSIKGNDFENQWGEFQYSVYFLLHHQANPQEVAKQLTKIQKNKFNTEETSDQNSGLYAQFRYYLQPLNQVNLYRPDGQGNGIQVVYTLMSIGFIILLIACVNYVNLMTAKTTKRSKEISLRKIVGAKKMQLIFQYLTESSIIFSIALFLAIMMAYFCIPFFNEIAGKDLAFDFLSRDLYYILSITFLTTIILAGIYPAIIFSKKRIIGVTNGGVSAGTPQNHVRKLLVVIQFSCTIILIVSTIVFGKQFDFMRNKDLGYNKENVFLFEQKNFLGHYDAIRDELEKQAGILGVTAASSDLTNFGSETADIDWQGKSSEQQNFFITQVGIDRNFLQVMDIELSAGNGFLGTPADSNYVLLNETAVEQMGLKNPIGKRINFQQKEVTVAGVMQDFNFNDLKTAIKPCIFFTGMGFALGGMYVKTAPNQAELAIASVQKLWSKYNPQTAFTYSFLDEAFDKMYKMDLTSGQLITLFSILAILLSCVGLAGLVMFTTEAKVKEIGIRKTLGASVNRIIVLIAKEYLIPILIAIFIALPLSWLFLSKWLENYVYRTTLDWWVFILSGLITLALVVFKAGRISIKAAKANPIKALRNE